MGWSGFRRNALFFLGGLEVRRRSSRYVLVSCICKCVAGIEESASHVMIACREWELEAPTPTFNCLCCYYFPCIRTVVYSRLTEAGKYLLDQESHSFVDDIVSQWHF